MEQNGIVGIVIWVVGVLVALAVGNAMRIGGALNSIPYINSVIVAIAGWVVVIGAIVSVILAIFSR